MRYRRMGNSGLLVSELCLGTNTFGGADLAVPTWKTLGGLDTTVAKEIVKAAIDGGVNFIDTADAYASGQSEQIVGASLRELGIARQDVVVATKVGGRVGTQARNSVGSSRGYLISAIDASLKRLGMDYVDLWMIHFFDPATPLEETMRALDDIVRSGRVRYFGCSNYAGWQIAKACGISERKNLERFVMVESQWSIGTRELEREVVPAARDHGVGIMAWGALLGGLLSGKHERGAAPVAGSRLAGGISPTLNQDKIFDIIDVMRPIAQGHGVDPGQIALAWLLHQPGLTSAMFGSRRADQVAGNVRATEVKLSAEELKALDAVSALPLEYGQMMTRGVPMERAPYV